MTILWNLNQKLSKTREMEPGSTDPNEDKKIMAKCTIRIQISTYLIEFNNIEHSQGQNRVVDQDLLQLQKPTFRANLQRLRVEERTQSMTFISQSSKFNSKSQK